MTERPKGILLLNSTEVAGLLDLDHYIKVVEEAFKSHAEGRSLPTGLFHIDSLDGDFHIKIGGLQLPSAYFGLKVNGRFPRNRERHGLPNVQGIIYLADAATGTPLALVDSSHINLNTSFHLGPPGGEESRRIGGPLMPGAIVAEHRWYRSA